MDRLIHTALSGMRASMDSQRVIASNMANANTLGFRAEMLDQRAVTIEDERRDAYLLGRTVWPAWAGAFVGHRRAKWAREQLADAHHARALERRGVRALLARARVARYYKRRALRGSPGPRSSLR